MTYRTDDDHARETGPTWRMLKGIVRRVLVTLAGSGPSWQVLGVRSRTGGDEIFEAELFPGVGIFARGSSSTEAVVVNASGSKVPMIVATRDEETRKKVASQVGEGETAIFNGAGIVILKSDGTIHVRSHGGSALAIPTMADYNALKSWLAVHTHIGVTTGAGVTGAPSAPVVPTASGTTKARLE